MKSTFTLVLSSLLLGLLGLGLAFAVNHFDDGRGPRDRAMISLCALTGIGVVTGFLIAAYGLRVDSRKQVQSAQETSWTKHQSASPV